MNILIIARSFKPMTGGIAEYTHQIARHLQGAGDNVMVLSKKRSDDEKFDSTCSYIVKRYNYDSQNPGKLHWYYGMYKAIKEAIREHSPDFLINNLIGSATHRSGTHICWMFSRLLKIPYCIFTHGLEINKKPHLKKGFTRTLTAFKLKLKRTIALRGADRVFCNSSFTQGVVESFGIPHTKTAIINPGIAISDLEPSIGKLECSLTKRLKLRGKKVVLTLSRLVERKGIDMTIKAMEVVKENVPNVVYIIAGDGP
jgi:phosphatidylinositol alpha-1,6-mannosyltransferase